MSLPSRIDRYRVVDLLGQGGFAVVYAAVDESDGEPVALKIPTAKAGSVHAGWIRREASLAARLRHPGIVRLLGSGTVDLGEGPVPYIAFERIDGPTLEAIAEDLDADAIVSVGVQLLEALGYAHDAGVLHCDIKPANVLVEARDAAGIPRIRLADFGLAATRVPSAHEGSSLPIVAGTPGYLSPEQARGWGRLGPASDLYATGALLYRLVAGFAPHFGGDSSEAMRRALWSEPLPLEPRTGLAVSEALLAAVDHLMAHEPAARPASAYRARRELVEAARAPRTVMTAFADATADTIPPPPLDDTYMAAGLRSPSGREPGATPAAAISRHTGRRAALVGRRGELDLLSVTCTADIERERRPIVRIVGAFGTGRTRLLRELVSVMRQRGARVVRVTGRRGVRCPPFEVLSGLALDISGAAGVSPAWIAAERLSAALDAASVPRDDVGRDALIAGLIGVGLPTAVGTVRHAAYRAFLALLGDRRDEVLLAIDDAEQIDEDSLAVLELLARTPDGDGGTGAPRIVMTMRDAVAPIDPTVALVDVPLGQLEQRDSVDMLAALTDRDPSLLAEAAREAGGLPADLTEVAGAITAQPSLAGAFVSARVRGFPRRVMAVLSAAAIHDGDAPVRALAPMARVLDRALDEAGARAALDRLLLDGLLVTIHNPAAAVEPAVRFASERVRRRVLTLLDGHEMKLLHGAAASFLVRESYDASLGVQAALAAHAEEAGDLATAAHAHASAGRLGVAASRSEASAHLAMALTLARSATEAARAVDEPALLADLAALAVQRGEPETAELFARQALEIVEEERTTLRARLHRHLAESHNVRRRFDPAMEALARAIALLGDEGDPMELATSLAMQGWVLAYLDGRVEEGSALGARAREVASQIDAPEFRAALAGRLGGIYLRAGRWDAQLAANLEDLGLSATVRDVGGVIRAHINLGVCYTNRGLTALARAHTEHALELSRRYGYRAAEHIAMNNLALVAVDERRLEDAEALARATLALAERSDLHGGLGETRCTLARVALARGDVRAAHVEIEQMLAGADSEVDHEVATRIEGMMHIRRGRPDLAVELLRPHLDTPHADPYERACTRLVFASALRDMRLGSDADRQEAAADEVFARLGADPRHERRKWQA